MTTIQDVAREAGVGVGTVSRVLSRSPRVAPATRARVQEAIARLGYRPSRAAQALARGRSHTLEVVVPIIARPYYCGVLAGVVAALVDTDFLLNLRVLEQDRDPAHAFDEVGRRGHPAGVLFVRVPPSDALVQRLAAARVPAALVDAEHPPLASVCVDHRAAVAAMTTHLLSLGHRGIALLDRASDPFDQPVLTARRRGFRAALARAGISRRPEYEPGADWSAEAGAAALDSLLALSDPPTAIVTGGDTIAFGVIERARQLGLSVPGDLAVCGYGDVEVARYLGLTTVHVPMADLGRHGAALLLSAIEDPQTAPARERLPTQIVVRQTCGAPAPRR